MQRLDASAPVQAEKSEADIIDSVTNAHGVHAVLSPEEAWSWIELYGMVLNRRPLAEAIATQSDISAYQIGDYI